jgi:endonuclease YncB( thermonuclease family)
MGTFPSKNKDLELSIKRLKNIKNYEDIPYFTFNGKTFYGLPCNVYDGDTFSIIFIFQNNIIKYKCRALGYDSAEIKPRLNILDREKHIELAIAAKIKLIELLNKHPSKLVKVECHNFDKYGRILVNVWNMIDEKSINQIMIEEGYGKIYNGSTKEEW